MNFHDLKNHTIGTYILLRIHHVHINHLQCGCCHGGMQCRMCYDFSYFALFTYVFSLFLEVSHGAAALTHFSLTHIAATLLTYCAAIVLTHSIAILIALPHWCSIYSGQSCRLFFS